RPVAAASARQSVRGRLSSAASGRRKLHAGGGPKRPPDGSARAFHLRGDGAPGGAAVRPQTPGFAEVSCEETERSFGKHSRSSVPEDEGSLAIRHQTGS